jgi:hypothetical protein
VHLAAMRKNWRFLLLWTFFGLGNEYIKNVYEEFFLLKYYGGWSFSEAYNLPVSIRRWFLERLLKQKEDENKATEDAINKAQAGH